MYRRILKRVFDVFFAFSALIILSPLFIILFLLLFIHFKGSPFFVQERIGYKGALFFLFKFKTMNNDTDYQGLLLNDKLRVTFFGKFLRSTSLDELPQLFNILKGEMSLIGPRPMLPHYNELYNDFQKRRNEAMPGITGWAQIHGRNNMPWQLRFEYDVWYVENCSFLLDVQIFFKTLFFLRFLDLKNSNKEAPSIEFLGNN